MVVEAAVPVPSVSFSFDSLKPGELEAGCIGGGYDLKYLAHPKTRFEGPSEVEKLHPEYKEYDH